MTNISVQQSVSKKLLYPYNNVALMDMNIGHYLKTIFHMENSEMHSKGFQKIITHRDTAHI